jgi:hypothetical protein
MSSVAYELWSASEIGDEQAPRGYWTKIGVAFVNRDESINIKMNFLPLDLKATLQLRRPRVQGETAAS